MIHNSTSQLTFFWWFILLISDIWKQSRSAAKNIKLDIHAKLMKSYKQVPMWWYLVLLVGSIPLPLLMSFFWKEQVQLPWWGMLFAFGLASLVALPIGVIQATTNQVIKYIWHNFNCIEIQVYALIFKLNGDWSNLVFDSVDINIWVLLCSNPDTMWLHSSLLGICFQENQLRTCFSRFMVTPVSCIPFLSWRIWNLDITWKSHQDACLQLRFNYMYCILDLPILNH